MFLTYVWIVRGVELPFKMCWTVFKRCWNIFKRCLTCLWCPQSCSHYHSYTVRPRRHQQESHHIQDHQFRRHRDIIWVHFIIAFFAYMPERVVEPDASCLPWKFGSVPSASAANLFGTKSLTRTLRKWSDTSTTGWLSIATTARLGLLLPSPGTSSTASSTHSRTKAGRCWRSTPLSLEYSGKG